MTTRNVVHPVLATTCHKMALLLAAVTFPAGAQTAGLDPSFNIGPGVVGSYVHTLAEGPQGTILIGGNFSRVQGTSRNHLALLDAHGTVQPAFPAGSGPNGEVLAVAFQSDGRALIGGVFTRVNATNRNHIARLNIDGTVDMGFDPGAGADAEIRCIAVQPDGKVLIAGPFSRFNGVSRAGVARLNSDGSVDPVLNVGSGVGGERFADEIHLLADGKILIAGDFPTYNGVKRAGIARLNADGTLDTSFDPGAGTVPGDPILGMAVQPDGKILVAGSFTSFNRKPLRNIARINPDGSVDPSFIPGAGTSGGPVNGLLQGVAVEPDGKILICGWFDRADGVSRPYLARLLPSGRVDINFNARMDGQVRSTRVLSDGRILLGGDFSTVNGTASSRLARLQPSGPCPARLKQCIVKPSGGVEIEFSGDPTRSYCLEVSADLVRWSFWTNTLPSEAPIKFVDANEAGTPHRFYRAALR